MPNKSIGNQERIAANLQNLVVCEVGSVACSNHSSYDLAVNFLTKNELVSYSTRPHPACY